MLRSNYDFMIVDYVENFGGFYIFVGLEDVIDDMEYD